MRSDSVKPLPVQVVGLSRIARFIALMTALLIASPGLGFGQETEASRQATADWVLQLGSESYSDREQAEKALSDIGIAARDDLLTGLKSSDPEIRRSCRRILTSVLDADLKRRIEQFRSDKGGKEPELPGWKAFHNIVGDTPHGRELFATLVEEETALMESLEANSNAAIQAWIASINRMLFNPKVKERKQLNPTLIAALLLVMSQHESDDRVIGNNLASQLMQPQFSGLLKEGKLQDVYQKLLLAWLHAPGPNLMSQKLILVTRLGIREGGLPLPLRILNDAKARSPREVAMAIESVARLGGADHAARLVPLLEDARMCQLRVINKKRMEIQIRDVALAWLLHVTKQTHADYGMPQAASWFDQVKRSPQLAFNFSNFSYKEPEGRDPAFKMWVQWVSDHPLGTPPEVEKVTPFARTPAKVEIVRQTGEAPQRVEELEIRPADRALVYQLNRAREAIEEGRFVDATEGLGMLLAMDEAFYFQPERGVELYQQLHSEAERLLGQMPTSGLRSYELRYGAVARAKLRAWIERPDATTLTEIQRKYFLTEAGGEASYLLGAHHRTAGHPIQAAIHFERLSRLSPFAAKYEPALSLQLATCWRLAGLPDRATEVLARLSQTRDGAEVRIGGESITLSRANADPLAWLDRTMGPGFEDRLRSKTSLRTGDDVQPAAPGGPYLDAHSLVDETPSATVSKSITAIEKSYREKHQTMLPSAQPLVVDGNVIYRDAVGIQAVDLNTAELQWKSPLVNGLWSLLRFGSKKEIAEQDAYVVDGLQQQLWGNPDFGQLSSNGELVFVVEDPSFALGPEVRTPMVRADGQRELDAMSEHNQLVAYDVRSGKVKWELGGPADSLSPLSGGRFCGTPLCIGDYLYVVVEAQGQSLLLSLDTATGALLERYLIDVFEEERINDESTKINGQQRTASAPIPGARPVFADSMIICSTSKGRFVAVDLASKTVRWYFSPPTPNGLKGNAGIAMQQKQMANAMRRDRSDQWSDFRPIIAGTNVLLTPWESDKIYCLTLGDGRLMWSASREDGLYVAGVAREQAIVVGRSGARMINLKDGKDRFESPARWPVGAIPSGRGYVTEKRLYVPLSSAEVASVDLDNGRLVARSRAVNGVVPGNLSRVADYVVSCSATRLDRFPTLAIHEAELAMAMAKAKAPASDDKALERFIQLTEVMLYQGKTQQVIDRLQQRPEALATSDGARLFAEATLQLPSVDWKNRQALADQIEESLTDPVAKADFLTRLVAVYRDAGDETAALATAWRLVAVAPSTRDMVWVSPAHSAQRGRFLQQTISSLLARVSPSAKAEYDQKIKERLSEHPVSETVEVLGFHPSAHAVRLQIASAMTDEKERLKAELLFRRVLAGGSDTEKAEATARLALLLRDAGKTSEAARFFALLDGPLADTVCLDGQTGKEVARLSAGDPVQMWRVGNGPWQDDSPEKKVTKTNGRQATSMQWPIAIANDGTRMAPFVSADIDVTKKTLLGRDAQGAQPFKVELAKTGNANLIGNAAMNEGCVVGHLFVAWLGGHVIAVDQLTGETLWSRTTMKIEPNQWWLMPQMRRRMMLQQQVQQGLVSSDQLPRFCMATSEYVVFQEGRILTAVDPFNGERVWSRDDLPIGCEFQGDLERILATPEGSETAIVLNAIDGSRLGERKLPADKQLIARIGCKTLVSKKDKENLNIELYDTWSESAVWTRSFNAKAASWCIDNCELAVMEPNGDFVILSAASGEPLVEGKVDAESALRNVLAFRSNDSYLLIANRPEPKPDAGRRIIMHSMPGQLAVEGKVHCIDARTGDLKWTHEVTQQAIKANYPPQAPLVTFFRRHQAMIKNGNSWRGGSPEVRLQCLDRATGKVLHDAKQPKASDQFYAFDVDPKSGEISIQTRLEQLVFKYRKPEDQPQP